MLLKNLIKDIPIKNKKINVKGLAINSKKIKKGYIFFAIKGLKSNGEKYIAEAVKKGASVIICSRKCKYKNEKIPIIKTSNIRNYLSKIASKFFQLKPKNIIAVTGTNGKTSVADLFYQILSLNNIPVASIGTLGLKYKGKTIKSNLTSPDTILLHQNLEKIKKNKIDNVIIEASSHGLHQSRINYLKLKAGIFTNFSQDHLDYHKTMNSYLNSKFILFKNILSKGKTIISDKTIKEFEILKKIANRRKLKIIDVSVINKKISKIKNLKLNEFQSKNLSMAIAAAKFCSLNEEKIFNSLKKIKDVSGRLELVRVFSNNIKVYVDFAHTPDALKKTLKALRDLYGDNISIVFGCGGDRDFKKRPMMAKIVNSYCKKIYITDDNPRNENPHRIRQTILKYIKDRDCFNIGNRSKAIRSAIKNAEPNDIILIAGKGHESEQIYKNRVIKISDKQIIKRLNSKIKKISLSQQNYLQNQKILNEIQSNFKAQNFNGISIDTRMLKKDNLFLTIKGKNNNGAKFVTKALKKGAKYIVSSQNIKKQKNKTIKVKNEIKFLNKYASKKREKSRAKIIAVTGSAGKTSLKNLIKDLLNNFGKTLSSPKSYNNHFGVPLSLSQLKIEHKFGVFEVGMSKKGEIDKLTKLIRPHFGIITNIGEAHIENFKNLRGIADAKGEIIQNIEKGGTIILNRDDEYFTYLEKKAKKNNLKIVTFGINKKSNVQLVSKSKKRDQELLTIKIKEKILKVKIKNINFYNVL